MEKLWVDKHRPETLSQLSYHPEITDLLTQLAIQSDFPVCIYLFSILFSMDLMDLVRKHGLCVFWKSFMVQEYINLKVLPFYLNLKMVPQKYSTTF
jgi:hypothetical protein